MFHDGKSCSNVIDFSVMNSAIQKKSDVIKKKLYFLALNYLKRYSVTVFQFEAYLNRKYYDKFSEICSKEDYQDAVAKLVEQLVAQGYMNDARYLEMKVESLFLRNKSVIYMKQHLMQKGFADQVIMDEIEKYYAAHDLDPHDVELEQITNLVRKKRLGQSRENFKKDLMKLIRAGYSYDLARRVLDDLLIK